MCTELCIFKVDQWNEWWQRPVRSFGALSRVGYIVAPWPCLSLDVLSDGFFPLSLAVLSQGFSGLCNLNFPLLDLIPELLSELHKQCRTTILLPMLAVPPILAVLKLSHHIKFFHLPSN